MTNNNFFQVNGGGGGGEMALTREPEVYNEDEVFDESEEEEGEGGVDPLANGGEGGGVREGRVDWEVTNTCDICKNIFTLNSYLNVHI